jgi:NAD-dependent deacetylase
MNPIEQKKLEVMRSHLSKAQRVAVLTGAGVSAASGLETFRGSGGLWNNYRATDLATPEAYARDPETVWAWYFWRFERASAAEPNAAHTLLAELETRTPDFTLVTQNVDGLHHRAGSQNVVELHGNLTQGRCEQCGKLGPLSLDMALPPRCPACGNRMRPNVVWFGEALPHDALERAAAAFSSADIALVIGTSGVVEPAASLAHLALQRGAAVVEINPEATPLSPHATLFLPHDAASGLAQLI